MTQDTSQDPIAESSFQVVEKKDVDSLDDKKKKIDVVMDIVKEHGLDADDEFMKEIQDAVDASLKD